MYNDLDVKCEKCNKLLKLGDYDHHLNFCGKPKCKFFNACERYVAKVKKNKKNIKRYVYVFILYFIKYKINIYKGSWRGISLQ